MLSDDRKGREDAMSLQPGDKGMLGLLSLRPREFPFGLRPRAHVAGQAGSRAPLAACVQWCSLPFFLPGRHLPWIHRLYVSAASPRLRRWPAGPRSSPGSRNSIFSCRGNRAQLSRFPGKVFHHRFYFCTAGPPLLPDILKEFS